MLYIVKAISELSAGSLGTVEEVPVLLQPEEGAMQQTSETGH